MKNRSKPRYLATERGRRRKGRKDRPLNLTPQHPLWGWARTLGGVFLTTVLPTALLWWWTLTMSAYRVVFASPASDVTLDGHPVRLNSRDSFEIPRLPLGERRLRYHETGGHDVELALHPRLTDNDATPLTIEGGAAKGVPDAEPVTGS